IISLGAGFLFGVVVGTIAVSLGSTLGACAAFLVGRTVARDWVSQKVRGNAKFAAVSDAVAREGFKVVLLTRLSPVFPFNLLNYAYGLTEVPFWKYALASWIGMLPGTILYVYIGSTIGSMAQLAAGDVQGGTAQTVLKWVGFVVTVAVTVLITRIARKALKNVSPRVGSEVEV
ncbi:MAG TPA: TVP38/TMEM64 family protein, partial [Candidatus Hydrogenedentes bacterium]|nr:TVP38/TMEM64 family protein [Candidatus Hydrogenedentota bacterium]